jgi:hypothetical protein
MAKTTYTLQQLHDSINLPCTHCNGTGTAPAIMSGNKVLVAAKPCFDCNGSGSFDRPDIDSLVKLIKGRRPGTLRSKRPDSPRAYYIWRLARFHGGQDVCLPMAATFEVGGDPYVPYLDAVAERVAQHVYGSHMAGALRWAHAMGHEVSDSYLNGSQIVPPSAMPGGPVVLDNHKPECEQLELV